MALGSLTVPLSGCSQERDFYFTPIQRTTRHKKRLTCNGNFTSLITLAKVRLFSHSSKCFSGFLLKNWNVFAKLYKKHKNKDTKRLHIPNFAQKRQNVQFCII
jgi:hypothetical protein